MTINFEFLQENPVVGAGFVYKSETDAYYFDGTAAVPIRQTAEFTATTGSGTSALNISSVAAGTVVQGMEISGLSGQESTVTITAANPAIVSWASHGLTANTPVRFTTTGDLPTGLLPDVTYYVLASGLAAGSFQVSLTIGGTAVSTAGGTQSGVHTAQAVIRIVSFGTFNGTAGTVNLSLSRTWANPTTVTGYYSNNRAAQFSVTAGTGTTTLTIGSVLQGEVVIGQEIIIGSISTIITAFGTFSGTSGTITVSNAPTFTAPVIVYGNSYVLNYPTTTVQGIIYLNGTYYVMTPEGSIYGSDINDPLTWSALNVIQCQAEPDGGTGLARQLNLVVAFNAYSTEFFYDAGNPTGSPLLPYSSAFIEVGCAAGKSIAQTDNTLYFIGVTKQKGRGVYRLNGTNPEYVSNPFIDRLLNADNLEEITAHCIRISGHIFYILYLPDSDITLVFDSLSGYWAYWTVSALGTPSAITGATWANGVVTVTKTAHGYNAGDLAVIASSNPSAYNGEYTINVPDANTFTYEIASNPGTYVGSATSAVYTQSPFAISSYTYGNNLDLVQDSTTGFVYALDNNTYEDNGNPIDVLIRTFKFDSGNNDRKFTSCLEIIGDKVDSTAYIRFTDDDYRTWSKYRPVNLDQQRSQLNRLGNGRRRAYELRHHDNVPLRLEALEITVLEGKN